MKATAIIYRMIGPSEAVKKAASKLHTMHQVEGKIVRRYEAKNAPTPLPEDADIFIITEDA